MKFEGLKSGPVEGRVALKMGAACADGKDREARLLAASMALLGAFEKGPQLVFSDEYLQLVRLLAQVIEQDYGLDDRDIDEFYAECTDTWK
jgi:hypothetical protein